MQLGGKIIAPTDAKARGSVLLQWFEFTELKGITVRRKGITDGQNSVWWTKKLPTYDPSEDIRLTSNSNELVSNKSGLPDSVSSHFKHFFHAIVIWSVVPNAIKQNFSSSIIDVWQVLRP